MWSLEPHSETLVQLVSFSNVNLLNVNCDTAYKEDSSNGCSFLNCYHSSHIGKVGNGGVCTGMLIVDRSMLTGAVDINGGIDKEIRHSSGNYTFGDSQYNIFTGQVTDMHSLFTSSNFNSDINYWDVSRVTDMGSMFKFAKNFNQPLNNWDVSRVTGMRDMFVRADNFNQPLNNWDVSRVTGMRDMFHAAFVFNQPLNNWNVSRVTDMGGMFMDARNFNQNLTCWNVSKISSKPNNFNVQSALTSANLPIWGTSGIC